MAIRDLVNQLQHILRRLARAPVFTGVTLLTLAIGIGANTAIFSVVDGILLKPLPYPKPDQLIAVSQTAPGIGINKRFEVSPAEYFVFREESRTLQKVGLWSGGSSTVTGLAEPEQVPSLFVTHEILEALDVAPALGHWFSAQDDVPGGPEVVILTHGYWQRRFGAAPAALGRTIVVGGRAREIVGILPPRFRFLDRKADLLMPLRLDRGKVFVGQFSYQGIARLKPFVTVTQANADIGRMIPMMFTRFPPPPGYTIAMFEHARLQAGALPLKEDVTGDVGKVLWVVMATIGMVLLIACANVANLFLVRVESRQHELAIRAALGAGWLRIARELLLESLLLGLAGGLMGVGVAQAALRLLIAIGPAQLPRLDNISIDPRVLLFALTVSLFCGVLFGLIPILKHAAPRIVEALRAGGRTMSQSRERHRARNTLVVVQTALALVLLIAAGLMIRTFAALRQIQPGFTRPAEIQTLEISIPEARVRDSELAMREMNNITQKIQQIPGVISAAFASSVPTDGHNSGDPIYAEDHTYRDGELAPIRRFKFAAPGYFQTMGNPLLAGRDITWTDIYDHRQVGVITENLARELWHDPAQAIGKRIRESVADPWREVIGVVGDVRDDGVGQKAPTTVYWPMLMRNFWGNKTFLQRTAVYTIRTSRAGTEELLSEIRKAVWSVDANLPLARVRTMEDVYRGSMARTSFTLVMLAIAGAMALLLGMIGIYGAISYSVSQRAREIGIRLALGAQQRELRRMFVRHGLLLAVIGIACGLAVALALTRLMSSLLFEIKPVDPITYTAVAGALAAAATAASYLPARRASMLDPVRALRSE